MTARSRQQLHAGTALDDAGSGTGRGSDCTAKLRCGAVALAGAKYSVSTLFGSNTVLIAASHEAHTIMSLSKANDLMDIFAGR